MSEALHVSTVLGLVGANPFLVVGVSAVVTARYRPPAPGDGVVLDGVRMCVEAMDGRRVTRLRTPAEPG
jgi:hypothetical protein